MPGNDSERLKRMRVGRYADWVKRFDVNEYVQNPPMIEKLYEEKQLALTSSFEMEDQVRNLELQLHNLSLKSQKLELKLEEASRRSFFIFAITLLATLLVGIGVNVATSSPGNWTGWIMIIAACILECIAFFLQPRGATK
jgi:hypothetical protein